MHIQTSLPDERPLPAPAGPPSGRRHPVLACSLIGLSVACFGAAFSLFSDQFLAAGVLFCISAIMAAGWVLFARRAVTTALAWWVIVGGCGLLIGCLVQIPVVEWHLNRQAGERCKTVVKGIHGYTLDHKDRFPPPTLFNKDGEPLLSWRVLILPYLGEKALFDQFRLDEPWDSPHNIKLLPHMPAVYRLPGRDDAPHTTAVQFLVGPGALFENANGSKWSIGNIPDGTGNTIAVVEARVAVPWTKPDDVAYNSALPLPAFGANRRGYFTRPSGEFVVGMGDAWPRHYNLNTVTDDTLRKAINPHDGPEGWGPNW